MSGLHKRKRINHNNNKFTNLSELRRKKNVFPSYLKIFDIRDIRKAYIVFVRRLKEETTWGTWDNITMDFKGTMKGCGLDMLESRPAGILVNKIINLRIT